MIKITDLKCGCYKCRKEVPYELGLHFTAEDGRILCNECSVNEKSISKEKLELLKKYR